MFNSEYCMVDINKDNKIVTLKWKKFASGNNYREPVKYVVKLFENNKSVNFVVDARNGFEDEKEDVEWGVSEFIPKLAKTDCKNIIFIMNVVTEIEDEMDMWTKEFKRYFNVYRVKSYEEAIDLIIQKGRNL